MIRRLLISEGSMGKSWKTFVLHILRQKKKPLHVGPCVMIRDFLVCVIRNLQWKVNCSLAHLLSSTCIAEWTVGPSERGTLSKLSDSCYITHSDCKHSPCVCKQSRVAVGSHRSSGVPSLCILNIARIISDVREG